MPKSIYLAGPIQGQKYTDANSWREDCYHFFKKHGIEAFSPMRGKTFLEDFEDMPASYENNFLSAQKTITVRDRQDATKSDLILINFEHSKQPSLGTCIEIGWANANNIPIIINTGNNEIHNHPMINEICIIVNNLKRAKLLALQFLNPDLKLPKL